MGNCHTGGPNSPCYDTKTCTWVGCNEACTGFGQCECYAQPQGCEDNCVYTCSYCCSDDNALELLQNTQIDKNGDIYSSQCKKYPHGPCTIDEINYGYTKIRTGYENSMTKNKHYNKLAQDLYGLYDVGNRENGKWSEVKRSGEISATNCKSIYEKTKLKLQNAEL